MSSKDVNDNPCTQLSKSLEASWPRPAHPEPDPMSLPRTLTTSVQIDSIPTDVFVQFFGDRVFVGVSQLSGKIATYLLCQAIISPTCVDYEISHLLGPGREEAGWAVCARMILDRIRKIAPEWSCLVLGVSLLNNKGHDRTTIFSIVDFVATLCSESASS